MGLREKAANGVFWNSVGTIGAGLINFILTIILARLLTPADFGLLALLVIFSVISETFVNSGFSQAIIRDNNATTIDLSSVFYFNLSIALTAYIFLFFGAPLIATFYNEPRLINLSRFTFLTIIFNSLSIVQNANFSRQLKFKPQAIASVSAVVISGAAAVVLANEGLGVWALAINMVLFAFLKTFFLWLQSNWRPVLQISHFSIKKYFKFGGNLLIQGLVDKIVTNVESLIIGRIYTKVDLGLYSQARKLDDYFIKTATNVIQAVTYPLLSKLGNNSNRLKDGYRKVLGVNMVWTIPLAFFIFSSAENLITTFYGQQWVAAVPYLRLWAIIGLTVSVYSIFINIFLVTGESGKLLKISLARQALRIISIFLLIKISIMHMLWGIFVVTLASGAVYVYAGGKLINYTLFEVIKDLWQIILTAAISALCVFFLGLWIKYLHFFLKFIFQSLTMLIVYWGLISMLKIESYLELKKIALAYINRLKNT